MLLEFEKAVEDLNEFLVASRNGFREGWSGFYNAKESYKRASQVRERMLQNVLKEKGLAVCSGIHSDWTRENVENPSAEQLGIYPRDQMRLYFYRMGPYDIQGEYGDSTGTTTLLHLYCPEHFPKNSKWTFRKGDKFTYYISSEVVQQDGKFILTVNQADITRLVNKGGGDIEPNGVLHPEPVIYRYFGIPDLPEKPSIGNIEYGR